MPRPTIKFTQLFIDGVFVDAVDGGKFATIDPATGETIAEVSEAAAADVDKAVRAAHKAFQRGSPWRTLDASGRGRLLYKLSLLVERDREILASLDSLDNGKPFTEALGVDLGLGERTRNVSLEILHTYPHISLSSGPLNLLPGSARSSQL